MINNFIKAKHLFFYSILFFSFNFSLNAQTNFSITAADANEYSNAYNLTIGFVGAPTGCNSRKIVVQIGILEYISASNSSDWTVSQSPGVVTFTNNINSSSGGSQNIILKVRFKQGVTCNNIEQIVSAVLTNCTSSNNSGTQQANVTLKSKTKNTSIAFISQIFPQLTITNPQTLCLGSNVVKYHLRLYNDSELNFNSYSLTNVKVKLQLAGCATLVGIYKGTNPTPTSFTSIANNVFQFNTPDSPAIGNSMGEYYIFVKYPCSPTCSNNATLSHPVATIIANSSCINNLTSAPATTNPSTFLTTSTCNSCNSNSPANDRSYVSFPCPLGCNPTIAPSYVINIPPGNTYVNPTLYLEADIPTGLTLVVNATTNNNAGISDYFRPNSPSGTPGWQSTFDANYPTTKVRWQFTYNTYNSLLISRYLSFSPSGLTTTSQPVFQYRIINGNNTTPIYTNQISSLPQSCDLQAYASKKVKKKSDPDTSFATITSAVPSDVMTYRVVINNSGSGTIPNFSFEDQLNSKHTYVPGSFRYIYSTSYNLPSSSLINLPETTSIITNPDLGTISVERNPNSIKLYGANFKLPLICYPSPMKYIIIEFDTKINSSVLFNQNIPNNAICYSSNTAVTIGGGNSTNISISPLYKVKNEMFTRCSYPPTNSWLTSTNAITGDIVDFKMRLSNEGSIPIKLTDLINLKPQVGDRYEIGSGSSIPPLRNSTCQIDYNCTPVLINTIPGNPLLPINANPIYTYSTNTVNMIRTMLTPPNQVPSSIGDIPNFSKPCFGANWVRVNFNNNNGLIVNPGDAIEIIYQGKIIGGAGTVAKNSFTFNAVSAVDPTIHINSNPVPYDVVITNNGTSSCPQPPPPCYDCSSFDLVKKSKYLVSGWVREEDPSTPEKQFKNYLSSIKISFTDVGGALITTPQLDITPGVTIPGNPEFFPTGEIIDGWQRIVGEFIVPNNVDDMKLELINKNANGTMAYFDDIRVLPSNGSMKSFVYDQKTQRLMAELDENNYTTFYEYDLEGGLIRIKKETEKGVFTIQETRSGNVKK